MPFFINRAGERLWFDESGSGSPLVFVHGWCMSSSVWRYQQQKLEKTFRIIAPDIRGHGKSKGAVGRLDFETFSEDLSDMLHFLDLKEVVLVGWSMGAQIAMQAYPEIKERLAGLLLLSATPCFTASADYPFGLPRNETSGMKMKVGRNAQRAFQGFHTRMFTEDELANEELAGAIKTILTEIEPPETVSALSALESLTVADMRDLLPEINIPVLVIYGDSDKICLPSSSGYLADNIRGAKQKIFFNSGHALFMTRHEEFNSDITRFAEIVGVSHV